MSEEEITLQARIADLRIALEEERQKNREIVDRLKDVSARIVKIKEYAKIFMDNSRPNVDPAQESMHYFAMSFLSGELEKI